MPTTANFSLEYPDDNSSVDIAGHFETLADDVDAAINTRLALTGGTLTGSLSGTSLSLSSTLSVTGTTTLTGDLTISKASATHTINSTSGTTNVNLDSVAGTYKYLNFRTGTSARWTLGTTATAESGSNAGTDLFIGRSTDAGAYIDAPLAITRSTGAFTLTGDVTINKASPSMVITGSGLSQLQITSTASNYAQIELSRAAGQWGATFVRSGSALRWGYGVNGDAESGANAGSNFVFYSYSDAGSYLGNPLTITRSTGAVTMSRIASPAALGDRISLYDDRNGLATNHGFGVEASTTYYKSTQYHRWYVSANADGGVSDMMQLDSQTLSLAHTTDSSSVSTGSIVTGGGVGIAKALYVGTTLNVAGATTLTGDLTISKASPVFKVSSSSGNANAFLERPAGSWGQIYFRTGTSTRWVQWIGSGSESGSNAGSDFGITRYDDAGSSLGTALTITRSTGAVTLTGDLTISKSSPVFNITAAAGTHNVVRLDSPAGYASDIALRTGTSNRWTFSKLNEAETGSDAGSNFVLYRYLDSGSYAEAIRITRASGLMTLTGDLTISKATARLTVDATSNDGYAYIGAAADKYAGTFIRTGSSPRWGIIKSNYGEPGSNVGSDFLISRYTDAGALIGNAVIIERANGRVTLYDSGATAGLALGSSGPRMMSGTGSPEGVVTAPIGSIWFQTNSTVGVTHWKKASGAGNTGWVVMSGDTGWRDVSASLDATFLTANPNAKMRIRRTNDTVQVAYQAGTSATFTTNYATVYDPPTGFRTRSDTGFGVPYMALMDPTSATGTTKTLYVSGNSLLSGGTWVSATNYWGNMTYTTTETWPTSLPGSAA